MNNILITQKYFIDERNSLSWFLEKNWFKYFEKKKIKLVPLNPYSFKRKKLLSLNPKALILTGGNDLYDVIKLSVYVRKFSGWVFIFPFGNRYFDCKIASK